MKRIFVLLCGVILVTSLSGCAAILIGSGVAGGLIIGRDSAKLAVDASFDHAFEVACQKIEEMGTITEKDERAGRIKGHVKASNVVVKIKKITANASNITVYARKMLMPNVDLAVEMLNDIEKAL